MEATMRLGIDFGTTRTVVAAVDRGNYPVVGFETPDGDVVDHWPTVVATDGQQLVFGPEAAVRLHEPGWTGLRGFKRLLATAGPETRVTLGDRSHRVFELLQHFLSALATDLREHSTLEVSGDAPLQAMVAVPARASSAQRFLTLEAFRGAGFDVVGVLNEPSAAGVEYAHRYARTVTSNREDVLVYDLGGGTFDASLVRLSDGAHEVLGHAGLNDVGGQDFDAALLELALAAAGADQPTSEEERVRLLERARHAKEGLNANSRRAMVELDDDHDVTVQTAALYEACRPLVERTLAVVDALLPGDELEGIAGIYVVGGASDLPVVARTLRDVYGRRVKRSQHPSGATAVGLAIALDEGVRVSERFGRAFGVFREREAGEDVAFDPILTADVEVGEDGLQTVRRYRPVHNVGVFRFAECDRLSDGEPVGDLLPVGAFRVPFDPDLRNGADLDDVAVERLEGPGPLVEERYRVDATGSVEVEIVDLGTGWSQSHRLGA
jgi:molecular chaperone DnaK (HSP70)